MLIEQFNRDQLHKGAAQAIDKDGAALVDAREVAEPTPNESPAFKSRRNPSVTITSKEIVDEPLMAWSDFSGHCVGRYFYHHGEMIALQGDGYKKLRKFTEKVLAVKPFSYGLSETFVEVEIFKWWRAAIRDGISGTLSSHLLDESSRVFAKHQLMIPLANLEIERAFRIGDVLITPFDPSLFENFGKEATNLQSDQANYLLEYGRELREEFGHLTAVQIEVIGEPEFARDRARMVAADVADVFRVMSPAAVSWNVRFACFPLGLEHEPRSTVIELRDQKFGVIQTGLLHSPSFRWSVSSAEIQRIMKEKGFRNCAVFFVDEPLKDYHKRVKVALSAYAQAVGAMDLRNRLLYAMSAAEHLLLRNENEPIQTNVGERMAFLIAKEPSWRREILLNFKKVYGFRSRQVHHLASVDDEDALSTFFMNMWILMLTAIQNIPNFSDHRDFLEKIDDLKFA